MKMLIPYLACLALSATLAHAGAGKSVFMTGSGLPVEVRSANVHASNVGDLFDGDTNSAWIGDYSSARQYAYEMDETGVSLVIRPKESVYITGLTIVNGCPETVSRRSELSALTGLYIERRFSGEPTYPMGEIYDLGESGKVQEIDFDKVGVYSWMNIFPTDRVILHAFAINGPKDPSQFCISEVDLKYSKDTPYKPSMPWADLKNEIMADIEFQDGRRWDSPKVFKNNRKLFDFIFYAQQGNAEASNLFESFSPIGVGTSEAVDFIWRPLITRKK